MSLLTIVQNVCGELGVPVPTAVMANVTDPQVLQMVRLLEREGKLVSKRGDWEGITFEATHTTTAAEDQGAITTIASNGFRYIKNDTLWDRTDILPIPLIGSTGWQTMKAVANTGPRYRYRIRGGKLLITPTPAASHTLAFEYISANWILGANGSTYKQVFTLDTDTVLIPEDVMEAGLIWRWKREKGLDYSEEFRTYEALLKDALGRDGGKKTLAMDGGRMHAQPAVVIPQGSWNL